MSVPQNQYRCRFFIAGSVPQRTFTPIKWMYSMTYSQMQIKVRASVWRDTDHITATVPTNSSLYQCKHHLHPLVWTIIADLISTSISHTKGLSQVWVWEPLLEIERGLLCLLLALILVTSMKKGQCYLPCMVKGQTLEWCCTISWVWMWTAMWNMWALTAGVNRALTTDQSTAVIIWSMKASYFHWNDH